VARVLLPCIVLAIIHIKTVYNVNQASSFISQNSVAPRSAMRQRVVCFN
jgi:uncharacterized protein (DUF2235 family)